MSTFFEGSPSPSRVVAKVVEGTEEGMEYGCSCLDLTFHDWYGNKHGNCASIDQSGLRWCYVSAWSSCYNKKISER